MSFFENEMQDRMSRLKLKTYKMTAAYRDYIKESQETKVFLELWLKAEGKYLPPALKDIVQTFMQNANTMIALYEGSGMQEMLRKIETYKMEENA